MCSEMQPYSRHELIRRVNRFWDDPDRKLSVLMLADLSGVSQETLRAVFRDRRYPMSEAVQFRVSRVLQAWERGEIAVMQGRHGTRFAEYRKEPKVRLARSWRLSFDGDGIRVAPRVRNIADYGEPTLQEQMEGMR